MPERDQALILIKELPMWAEEDSGISDARQKVVSALQKAQTKGHQVGWECAEAERTREDMERNRAGQLERKNIA